MKAREGWHSEQVRNESFKEVLPELGELQREVYEVVRSNGRITTEQIAELTGRYVHSIAGRIHELRELGYVEFCGTAVSARSGRKVSLWRIKNKQLNLF